MNNLNLNNSGPDLQSSIPYARISFVYFAYFAVVGALVPYWSLYLDYLEFSPSAIGFIVAIPMITKIIAPNLWGLLADKSGKRLSIARLGAAGSCLCFSGILFSPGTVYFIVLVAAYSFFWNAIHAQFEVVTLDYLHEKPETYSHVRVWGSIGFVVVVLILGVLFDFISIHWLPWFIFAFLATIFFASLCLPKQDGNSTSKVFGGFLSSLKRKPVYLFFLVLFLIQFSLGIYHAFFSMYMEDWGYNKTSIGLLWALGTIAEIILFWKVPKFLKRYSLCSLIALTLWLTLFRWVLTAFCAEWLVLLLLAQCIHAFTFGMAHVVAIEFVRRQFAPEAQNQAQAFYSAVGFGAANALGSVIGGLLFEISGQLAFVAAMNIVIIALFVFYVASKQGLLAE